VRAYNLDKSRRKPLETTLPILKVGPEEQSEERELEFELQFQGSLTRQQRFEMMLQKSRELAEELIRRGHRRPAAVLKRP
jgi:hypothetical protein